MFVGDFGRLNKKYDLRYGFDHFFDKASKSYCSAIREEWSDQSSWNVSLNPSLPRSSNTFINLFFNRKKWKQEKGVIPEIKENLRVFETFLTIENYNEVFEYFIYNADKMDNLINIVYKIGKLKNKYFGDEAQLALCINQDPEISDEFLKFYIRQDSYSENFMDNLDRLQEGYFEDLHKYDIWILVSSDFKSVKKK